MPQIYKRIYTYTGQNKWTPNERSAAFSSFAVSGDTTHNIGQLVSIRYEHYHSGASSRDWTLKGRLVLLDGTTIDSEGVTQRISKNTVVKFENYFTAMPTAEQFANIRYVQTLDTNGSTGNNGVLSWKANSELPIRLIVEFYETPPTRYAPQILKFEVDRVKADGNGESDPEGTRIATTVKLAFASGTPLDQVSVMMYTSTKEDVIPDTGWNMLTSGRPTINQLIAGVERNTSMVVSEYSAGITYYFTLKVSVGSETAMARATAFRAKAPIHITNNGVSFGGFSSATPSNPKEEFHNPVVFHKGFSMGGGNDVLTSIGIQHGKTESISILGSSVTEHSVPFSAAFASAPNVVASFDSTGNAMTDYGRWDYITMTVCDITTTGFKLRIKNGTSTAFNLPIQWVAIGKPK